MSNLASMFSHPVIPVSATIALGYKVISPRLLIFACLASALPDIDVLAFKFGISYHSEFGHRGFTHSIFFAIVLGLMSMLAASQLNTSRVTAFIVITLATASHGLIDACTNGGLGIAFLWPFDHERYFFAWRPIRVSPIGMSGFFTERGWIVFQSELKFIWLPATVFALLLYAIRKQLRI